MHWVHKAKKAMKSNDSGAGGRGSGSGKSSRQSRAQTSAASISIEPAAPRLRTSTSSPNSIGKYDVIVIGGGLSGK